MLPWVCSVIDYRWRQNFVKTKKWHTSRRRVCHCCFYHILTSSVIYYWPFIWYYWSFNKPDLKRGSKALRTDSKNSLRLMRSDKTPRMTQTHFASRSWKALYARLPNVESNHCFFRVFLSGYGKQQALQLGRMWEGLKDPWKSGLSH